MWYKLSLALLLGLATVAPAEAQNWRWAHSRPSATFRPWGAEYRGTDARQVWGYTANGGGAFGNTQRGFWAHQTLPDGTINYFRETGRTGDYVEMYNDVTGVGVRLTNFGMYASRDGVNWAPMYAGGWR